jgi:hypothetical protein
MRDNRIEENARQHDLTIEEVKACPLFANLTDAEAREVIETLKKFTVIVYNFYQKKKENTWKKI